MNASNRRVLLTKDQVSSGLASLAQRLRPQLAGKDATVIPIMGGATVYELAIIFLIVFVVGLVMGRGRT